MKKIINRNGGQTSPNMEWRTTEKYGARPLVAVWASAPYLHNNSVPTLYDLLLPAAQRPQSFPVGHHEYDPLKLGYTTSVASPPSTFDTSLDGNHNSGHSGSKYGTDLSDDQRMQLLEYLKSR